MKTVNIILGLSLFLVIAVSADKKQEVMLSAKQRLYVDGVNNYGHKLWLELTKGKKDVVLSPQWVFGPLVAAYYDSYQESSIKKEIETACDRMMGSKGLIEDMTIRHFIGSRSRQRTMGIPGNLLAYFLNSSFHKKYNESLGFNVRGKAVASKTAPQLLSDLKSNTQIKQALSNVGSSPVTAIISSPTFLHKWSHPFNPKDNIVAEFNGAGKKVKTTYMRVTHFFPVIEAKTYRLVGIPFGFGARGHHGVSVAGNGRDYLIIIQPKNGLSPQELLTETTWKKVVKQFKELTHKTTPVIRELQLPKFTLRSELWLNDHYKKLGAVKAFADSESKKVIAAQICEFSTDQGGSDPNAAKPTRFATLGWQPRKKPANLNINNSFAFVVYNHKDELVNLMGSVSEPVSAKLGTTR